MEDLGQRNSNRRVIRIHFHDIRHIVPPFLHDRIGSHILRRLLSFSFLTSKQNICILVPINGVIIYSSIGQLFFLIRPNGCMSLLILFLEARLQEHFKKLHVSWYFPPFYKVLVFTYLVSPSITWKIGSEVFCSVR